MHHLIRAPKSQVLIHKSVSTFHQAHRKQQNGELHLSLLDPSRMLSGLGIRVFFNPVILHDDYIFWNFLPLACMLTALLEQRDISPHVRSNCRMIYSWVICFATHRWSDLRVSVLHEFSLFLHQFLQILPLLLHLQLKFPLNLQQDSNRNGITIGQGNGIYDYYKMEA